MGKQKKAGKAGKEITMTLRKLKVGDKIEFTFKGKETFKSKKKGWADGEIWICQENPSGSLFKIFANRSMKEAGKVFGYKPGTDLRLAVEKGKGKFNNVRLWLL